MLRQPLRDQAAALTSKRFECAERIVTAIRELEYLEPPQEFQQIAAPCFSGNYVIAIT
jgi:hypothetical protein